MTTPSGFLAPPAGLIIDLVTPLAGDGALDAASLARLVARVLPAADGLLAGSPLAGEALDLPPVIRRELFAHLLPLVAGRVPIFFGITGATLEETRDLAAWVEAETRRQGYGGPLFLADAPLWYHSNRGLPQACQALLGDIPLPLILLNLPQVVRRRGIRFKHLNIRTHVFKKLATRPGILGLIYQGEMRRFLHYHHAAGARPGFAFYETEEVRFLTRPGAWGVVSGSAQLLPRAWQQVTRACLHPEDAADDPPRRYALWDLGNRLQLVSHFCQNNPVPLFKKVLAAQGVLASPATAPGAPFDTAGHGEKLLELLAGFAD
ncbi:MAG: dihydrodipicolinate synthase family protein [Thermodesulfobacteriota bacterium]